MANFFGNFPWLIIILLFVAGVITMVIGNVQVKPRARTVGVLLTSLAVLFLAIRFMVDTDAEKAERRTRQLVETGDKQNWEGMKNLLDADTVVDGNGKEQWPKFTGPAEISDAAKSMAVKAGLKTVYLMSLKTEQTGPSITVTVGAAIQMAEALDRPTLSQWEFDYRLDGTRWDLKTIRLLNIGAE
jgi:hypothetical protein